VRHQDSYASVAARVLMPHIVAPMEELMSSAHAMGRGCRALQAVRLFGGVPHKEQPDQRGGATKHHVKGETSTACAAKGVALRQRTRRPPTSTRRRGRVLAIRQHGTPR